MPGCYLWQCDEKGLHIGRQVASGAQVLVHLPALCKLLEPVVKLAGHNHLGSTCTATDEIQGEREARHVVTSHSCSNCRRGTLSCSMLWSYSTGVRATC
jgi:hypothetical protein